MRRVIQVGSAALLSMAVASAFAANQEQSETGNAVRDNGNPTTPEEIPGIGGIEAASLADGVFAGYTFGTEGNADTPLTGETPLAGQSWPGVNSVDDGATDSTLAGLIAGESPLPTEPPQDIPDPVALLEGCAENMDPSCLSGGGEPDEPGEPADPTTVATDDDGAMIELAATGTVTAADEECTVSVSSLTFNYSAAETFTAFDGKSDTQTFSINCGVDRTENANFKIGTNADASESTVTGTVTANDGGDAQPVTFTVFDADTDAAISSTSDVSANNEDSRDVNVLLSFDKNEAKAGGSVALDADQFLFVILDDSSS